MPNLLRYKRQNSVMRKLTSGT